MQALLYAFNIGTLALWVSVAAVGGVGRLIGPFGHVTVPELPVVVGDESTGVEWLQESSAAGAADGGGAQEPAPESPAPAPAPAPVMPAPPQMTMLAELPPLPEVPEVATPEPAMPTVSTAPAVAAPSQPSSQPSQPAQATAQAVQNPDRTPAQPGGAGRSEAAGRSGGQVGRGGTGTSMSAAARLAAGRMPPPHYPFEARSRGQTGTVIVEFTIGSDGRVSSAQLFSPCRWPALNDEALRAVKSWQFPAGEVMTFKKPIVFTLKDR